MTSPARWENGEPVNLTAATADSLRWLRWFARCDACRLIHGDAKPDAERLAGCIRALEAQLGAEAEKQ